MFVESNTGLEQSCQTFTRRAIKQFRPKVCPKKCCYPAAAQEKSHLRQQQQQKEAAATVAAVAVATTTTVARTTTSQAFPRFMLRAIKIVFHFFFYFVQLFWLYFFSANFPAATFLLLAARLLPLLQCAGGVSGSPA